MVLGFLGLLCYFGVLSKTEYWLILWPCLLVSMQLTREILKIVLNNVSVGKPVNFYFAIKPHNVCRLDHEFLLVIASIFNPLISTLNHLLSIPLDLDIRTMIMSR